MTDIITNDDHRWGADHSALVSETELRDEANHPARAAQPGITVYPRRMTATARWELSVLIIAALSALCWSGLILLVIAALSTL